MSSKFYFFHIFKIREQFLISVSHFTTFKTLLFIGGDEGGIWMSHHYFVGNEYLIATIGIEKTNFLFKLHQLLREEGLLIDGNRWIPYKLSTIMEKLHIKNELQLKSWINELHKDGYIIIQPITTCKRSKWVRLSTHINFNHIQYKVVPTFKEAA